MFVFIKHQHPRNTYLTREIQNIYTCVYNLIVKGHREAQDINTYIYTYLFTVQDMFSYKFFYLQPRVLCKYNISPNTSANEAAKGDPPLITSGLEP